MRWLVKKKDVSSTEWLYGKKHLYELRNLSQRASYDKRIEMLEETLTHCTKHDVDYSRAKDVVDAKDWWRDRKHEVYND